MATPEECSNGGTVVTYSHSWQEIYDALEQGKAVFLKNSSEDDEGRGASMHPIISASSDIIESEYSCIYLLASSTSATGIVLSFADATSKTIVNCIGVN